MKITPLENNWARILCFKTWKLFCNNDFKHDHVLSVLNSLDQLKKRGRLFRYRGKINIGTKSHRKNYYVKQDVVRVDPGKPKEMIRSVRALKKGNLLREGHGYLMFIKKGIPVPPLLCFGESRYLSFRVKTVLVTGLLKGVNLQDKYFAAQDSGLLLDLVKFIAFIHSKGLTHGDCMLHNFFWGNNNIIALDLEKSSVFDPSLQLNDLVGYGLSLLRVTSDKQILRKALRVYDRYFPHGLPGSVKSIVALSEKKAFLDCQ